MKKRFYILISLLATPGYGAGEDVLGAGLKAEKPGPTTAADPDILKKKDQAKTLLKGLLEGTKALKRESAEKRALLELTRQVNEKAIEEVREELEAHDLPKVNMLMEQLTAAQEKLAKLQEEEANLEAQLSPIQAIQSEQVLKEIRKELKHSTEPEKLAPSEPVNTPPTEAPVHSTGEQLDADQSLPEALRQPLLVQPEQQKPGEDNQVPNMVPEDSKKEGEQKPTEKDAEKKEPPAPEDQKNEDLKPEEGVNKEGNFYLEEKKEDPKPVEEGETQKKKTELQEKKLIEGSEKYYQLGLRAERNNSLENAIEYYYEAISTLPHIPHKLSLQALYRLASPQSPISAVAYKKLESLVEEYPELYKILEGFRKAAQEKQRSEAQKQLRNPMKDLNILSGNNQKGKNLFSGPMRNRKPKINNRKPILKNRGATVLGGSFSFGSLTKMLPKQTTTRRRSPSLVLSSKKPRVKSAGSKILPKALKVKSLKEQLPKQKTAVKSITYPAPAKIHGWISSLNDEQVKQERRLGFLQVAREITGWPLFPEYKSAFIFLNKDD